MAPVTRARRPRPLPLPSFGPRRATCAEGDTRLVIEELVPPDHRPVQVSLERLERFSALMAAQGWPAHVGRLAVVHEVGDDAQRRREVWPPQVDDDEIGAIAGRQPAAVADAERAVPVCAWPSRAPPPASADGRHAGGRAP